MELGRDQVDDRLDRGVDELGAKHHAAPKKDHAPTAGVKTDDDSDSMYKEYWGNLEDLADEIASESNETVRLDSYALISNAMETYMDKFKAAGIKKSQAEKLYKKVDAGLKAVSPKDEDAEQRRDETIQRLENEVQRKITTVYSNAVVAED